MLSKMPQLAVPNLVTQVTPAALFNRRLQGFPIGRILRSRNQVGGCVGIALECALLATACVLGEGVLDEEDEENLQPGFHSSVMGSMVGIPSG